MNANPTYLRVKDHAGQAPFLEDDVRDAEARLLLALEEAPPGTIVRVDLEGVRIASAAVRGLLRRALRRLYGGEQAELQDRFIALDNVSDSWHSVDVTMRAEDAIVVAHRQLNDPPQLLGKLDPAVATSYDFASARDTVTANMVMKHFDLSIAAASNRLATLSKHGLVRRIDQRATASGGREYVFRAIV